MLKSKTKAQACSELVKCLRLIRRLPQESRNILQMASTAGYDVPVTSSLTSTE